MIAAQVADLTVLVCVLGAAYCLGGLHGLVLAWSQPARMRRWAERVDRVATRVIEAEDRAAARVAETVEK